MWSEKRLIIGVRSSHLLVEANAETGAGRQTVKAKPVPPAKGPKGYKNHVKGSREETVHKVFDEKGRDVAGKKGLDLGLKPGTLVTWFGTWRRADAANGTGKTKAKGRAKTSARAKARKPAAKDTRAETNA